MGREQFVGVWKLVSSESQAPDGTVSYPMGRDAVGWIMYTPGGHMSVQIMRPGRPAFAAGHVAAGTDDEVRSALEGYLAYCGTYEVDDAARTVIHRPDCCLFPNWVGTEQRRHFEFSGDRLTLSAQSTLRGGPVQTARITWTRVE